MSRKNIIFLADDDPDIQLILKIAIQKANISCAITYFKDGQELMDHLNHLTHEIPSVESQLPDLVLTDLQMPCKDGLEVLKEMQSNPRLQNIPVVILTALEGDQEKGRCYREGVKLFLEKASSLADYIKTVSLLDKLISTIKLKKQKFRQQIKTTKHLLKCCAESTCLSSKKHKIV